MTDLPDSVPEPFADEPTVTAELMETYLRQYLATLQETAEAHLPPGYPEQLRQLSHLPAEVVGYVSTVHGAGFELRPAAQTSYRAITVHRPIEAAFLAAPERLAKGYTSLFDFTNATFIEFVHCNFKDIASFWLRGESDVTFERSIFEAAGWTRPVGYAELHTDRRASTWSEAAARERALRQVLAATVHVRNATTLAMGPAAFSRVYKDRMVLLLGSYRDGGEDRLRELAECLKSQGFVPLIVKDVDTLPGVTWQSKVTWLGSLARFVLFDDTTLSGAAVEMQIAKGNDWVTVVLRGHGKATTAMVAQISDFRAFWHELDYDLAAPCDGVAAAVQWAEANVNELAKRYTGDTVWRMPPEAWTNAPG